MNFDVNYIENIRNIQQMLQAGIFGKNIVKNWHLTSRKLVIMTCLTFVVQKSNKHSNKPKDNELLDILHQTHYPIYQLTSSLEHFCTLLVRFCTENTPTESVELIA